jgi:hypothetical protein
MKPKRALIIKKEFLDLIFNNGKIWEMRSAKTKIRGRIGLIESGSGLILGETELVDCGKPVNDLMAILTSHKHQIANLSLIEKWKYPWILENIKKYDKPIPYKHPRGAVIWVKL